MIGSKTSLTVAAALALVAMAGAADASKASGTTLCAILDQSGAFATKCRVSEEQKAIDVRFDATAETAAVACPKLVEAWAGLKLQFDPGWMLRIFPPGSSRQALAQCEF